MEGWEVSYRRSAVSLTTTVILRFGALGGDAVVVLVHLRGAGTTVERCVVSMNRLNERLAILVQLVEVGEGLVGLEALRQLQEAAW